LNFRPESFRTTEDVVSGLVAGYLLPRSGFGPEGRHREVRIADFRLALLEFFSRFFPSFAASIRPARIIVQPVHPGEKLERHVRKLIRYLGVFDVRYGLLTNGRELRIYGKISPGEIELLFQCIGEEISERVDDIRSLLTGEDHEAEISAQAPPAAEEEPAGDDPDVPAVLVEVLRESEDEQSDPDTGCGARPGGDTEDTPGENAVVLPCADETDPAEEYSEPPEPESPPPSLRPSLAAVGNDPAERERPRMKVIAIYHNKGGVGKTTIAVNLAAALGKKGQKVLLIDMDAQANATFAAGLVKFQFEEDDDIIQKYVYHLLESGTYNFIPDVVRRSKSFNTPEIDIVPSHIDLVAHQYDLTNVAASRSRLFVKLRQIQDDYDFTIIDTPPARDLYAEIPLIAADYLIVPSDLKPFANQGLNNVRNFVKQVNEYRESIMRNPLVVLGVLPSKIPTNAQYLKHTFPRQKQAISERHGFSLMESVIYDRMPLSASLSRVRREGAMEIPDPKSIFEFWKTENSSSAGQSAEDFEKLADEILTKTGWRE